MILTFIANTAILFRITFCAINLAIVSIVHIFKLDVRRQAILLWRALVNRLLARVKLLLVGLLGGLRKGTVIDCSCDIDLV